MTVIMTMTLLAVTAAGMVGTREMGRAAGGPARASPGPPAAWAPGQGPGPGRLAWGWQGIAHLSASRCAAAVGGAGRCLQPGALVVYKLRGAYARAGMGLLPLAIASAGVVRAFTRNL